MCRCVLARAESPFSLLHLFLILLSNTHAPSYSVTNLISFHVILDVTQKRKKHQRLFAYFTSNWTPPLSHFLFEINTYKYSPLPIFAYSVFADSVVREKFSLVKMFMTRCDYSRLFEKDVKILVTLDMI